MKVFRVVLVTLIFATLTVAVLAQTRLLEKGTNKPSNSPQPVAPANGIAIVDSGEFTEDKTGITRVTAALAQIEVKYQSVRKDLRDMRTRLDTLRTDIQNKRLVQDPNTTAQQTEQADKLDVEIKRKAEDAQASYQKDLNSAMTPIQADIQKALDAYAKGHGILLLIDANRVPLIYADASIDITKEFITEYNRTHPGAPARP
jgi:Skp family chaperone for outer membrane proteins